MTAAASIPVPSERPCLAGPRLERSRSGSDAGEGLEIRPRDEHTPAFAPTSESARPDPSTHGFGVTSNELRRLLDVYERVWVGQASRVHDGQFYSSTARCSRSRARPGFPARRPAPSPRNYRSDACSASAAPRYRKVHSSASGRVSRKTIGISG